MSTQSPIKLAKRPYVDDTHQQWTVRRLSSLQSLQPERVCCRVVPYLRCLASLRSTSTGLAASTTASRRRTRKTSSSTSVLLDYIPFLTYSQQHRRPPWRREERVCPAAASVSLRACRPRLRAGYCGWDRRERRAVGVLQRQADVGGDDDRHFEQHPRVLRPVHISSGDF